MSIHIFLVCVVINKYKGVKFQNGAYPESYPHTAIGEATFPIFKELILLKADIRL